MKCDLCGCQFPAGEAVQDTRSETSETRRGAYGRNTATVAVTMCPDCAASRAATRRLLYWVIALLVGIPILIGLARFVFDW